jgi:Spy/CpxP family protein refolding chaperone
MKTVVAFCLAALVPLCAPGEGAPAGEDPFARYLFPPDRVIGHGLELGLADTQKTAIRNEVQKAQGRFVDLQFELQGESERMTRLLQEQPVDEAKVLAEVDRILAIEKEIKKMQISLLVRIKNVLTPAQQAKLAEIQAAGK